MVLDHTSVYDPGKDNTNLCDLYSSKFVWTGGKSYKVKNKNVIRKIDEPNATILAHECHL